MDLKFKVLSTVKCGIPKADEKTDDALIVEKEMIIDVSKIPPNFVIVNIKAAGLNPVDQKNLCCI